MSTVAGAKREGPQVTRRPSRLTRFSVGVPKSINTGEKYCYLKKAVPHLLLLLPPPAGAGPAVSQSTSTSAPTMPSVAHVSPASARGASGEEAERESWARTGHLEERSPNRPSELGGIRDLRVRRLLIPLQAECQYRGLIGGKTQSRYPVLSSATASALDGCVLSTLFQFALLKIRRKK